MTFFHKIMVEEKKLFSSNAWHNFSKDKVISKCKNDKPFLIFKIPPPSGGGGEIKIYWGR